MIENNKAETEKQSQVAKGCRFKRTLARYFGLGRLVLIPSGCAA